MTLLSSGLSTGWSSLSISISRVNLAEINTLQEAGGGENQHPLSFYCLLGVCHMQPHSLLSICTYTHTHTLWYKVDTINFSNEETEDKMLSDHVRY